MHIITLLSELNSLEEFKNFEIQVRYHKSGVDKL